MRVVKSLDFDGVEVFAIINPLYTDFGKDDVRVLVKAAVTRYRLPMCETVENVLELDELFVGCEKEKNIEFRTCLIQCSIETPLGVENVFSFATSSSRVTSISFGAEDNTRLLGVGRTKTAKELFYARSRACNAISTAGIDAINTLRAYVNNMNGYSFQAGTGGASLAVFKFLGTYIEENNIKGSFASGGITAYLVELLEAGLFESLLDTLTFDVAASSLVRKKSY